MPPKARTVRARPGSRKAGNVASSRTGGKRERKTIQLEGRMAMLANGDLSVQDMDNEELARLQFRDSGGKFRGRPPQHLPAQLVNMMRKELLDRLAEKRRAVLEEMQDVLIGIANAGEKDSDRIKAAQLIIERELGKTPERVELSTGDKPFEVTMARSIRMKRPGKEE